MPFVLFLFVTPFLIHALGTARYGTLVLLTSLVTIASVSDLGLGAGGVLAIGRLMHQRQDSAVIHLHQEMISVFLLLGAATAILIWIFAPAIGAGLGLFEAVEREQALRLIRLTALLVAVAICTVPMSIVPRALELLPELAAIQVGNYVAVWVGAVALVSAGGGLQAVLLWQLTIAIGVFVILLFWNIRLIPGLRWRPVCRFGHVRSLAGYSLYSFVAQMSSLVTYHVDRILVGALAGPIAVAYYAVSVNVAAKVLSVGAAVSAFVFPRAVVLHAEGDEGAMRAFYLRAFRYTLLLISPILVPLIVLTPELLLFWLGKDFSTAASTTMRVLVAAYFVATLSVVPSQIYNGIGNAKIGAVYALLGASINVIGCFILIPVMGVEGAAVAAFLAMLQAIIYMGTLGKKLELGWLSGQGVFFFQIGIIMLLQVGLVQLLAGSIDGPVGTIVASVLGGLAFPVGWIVFRFVTSEDWDLLRRLISGVRRRL